MGFWNLIEEIGCGKNIPRRSFSKWAGKAAVGLMGLDTVANWAAQIYTNQMDTAPLTGTFTGKYTWDATASPAIIDKAVRTGEIDLIIYHISFDSAKPIEKYAENIKWIFGTLDKCLKVNIDYKYITPHDPSVFSAEAAFSSEELKNPVYKKRLDTLKEYEADRIENIIKNADIRDNITEYSGGSSIVNGGVSRELIANLDTEIDNYLTREDSLRNLDTSVVKIVISDFKESYNGVSRNTSYGNPYVLLQNKGITEEKYSFLAGHEIGHKLGLPHTVTVPPDIMSYSPIANVVGKATGAVGFGPESQRIWENIKKHYTTG